MLENKGGCSTLMHAAEICDDSAEYIVDTQLTTKYAPKMIMAMKNAQEAGLVTSMARYITNTQPLSVIDWNTVTIDRAVLSIPATCRATE